MAYVRKTNPIQPLGPSANCSLEVRSWGSSPVRLTVVTGLFLFLSVKWWQIYSFWLPTRAVIYSPSWFLRSYETFRRTRCTLHVTDSSKTPQVLMKGTIYLFHLYSSVTWWGYCVDLEHSSLPVSFRWCRELPNTKGNLVYKVLSR